MKGDTPGIVNGRLVPWLDRVRRVQLLDIDVVLAPETSEQVEAPVRPVLMLHGFGGDKRQLRAVAERIVRPGRPAVLPSLRGHGDSPAPEWGYSCLDFAADLHRIGDALGESFDIVGYSLGALLGVLSTVTWARGQVRSMVTIDQSFVAQPDRMVEDDQAEGRFLRWNYDFSHLIPMGRVPHLVLLAEDSPMVAPSERDAMRAWARDGLLRLDDIPGDHGSCVRDDLLIASKIEPFYRYAGHGGVLAAPWREEATRPEVPVES